MSELGDAWAAIAPVLGLHIELRRGACTVAAEASARRTLGGALRSPSTRAVWETANALDPVDLWGIELIAGKCRPDRRCPHADRASGLTPAKDGSVTVY